MIKQLLIFIISGYRLLLSPIFTTVFGVRCRFEESCSQHAQRVIVEFGAMKGTLMAFKRLLSCQPFA